MLGVNSYSDAYIKACQARTAEQMERYRAMAATADAGATLAFEPDFCNAMILSLECFFVHRLRGMEGKDGNPANEVRLLAAGLVTDGKLAGDKTIKYDPEKSVLGLRIGDPIRISTDDFDSLAAAFFAEIGKRYAA